MSRLLLILLLSGFVSFGILNLTENSNISLATENAVNNFSEVQARNIGNSTLNMLMSKVADENAWRQNSATKINLLDGTATYTVVDENFHGEDLIKFSVTAEYNGITKKIKTYAQIKNGIPFAIGVKAAITANNNVLTLGNMTVDGRNHDKKGNVVPKSGTYGVWTTKTFSRSGNSKIGGTSTSKTDYAPSKTPPSSIIAQNQSWPMGYPPKTPEEALENVPAGFSFKSYAISGAGGSQYVTDPSNLKTPLKGVTYVELPSGGIWNSANIEGEGVLIIHNNKLDATLKNSDGNFKGLVIADDIIHLHGDILGAVISLTENPSGGNTIGNGKGTVLYSKQILDDLVGTGGGSNYGFAKNRLDVKYWYE